MRGIVSARQIGACVYCGEDARGFLLPLCPRHFLLVHGHEFVVSPALHAAVRYGRRPVSRDVEARIVAELRAYFRGHEHDWQSAAATFVCGEDGGSILYACRCGETFDAQDCGVTHCGGLATKLCDWPIDDEFGDRRTCDLPLCDAHAHAAGIEVDFCPAHSVGRAGARCGPDTPPRKPLGRKGFRGGAHWKGPGGSGLSGERLSWGHEAGGDGARRRRWEGSQ